MAAAPWARTLAGTAGKENPLRARRGLSLGLLAATRVLVLALWAWSQQPPAPVREITRDAGGVCRSDAARWLRSEVASRFNQPIRYVVYSHDRADQFPATRSRVW